jgi:hypothetical protein
MRFAAVLLAFQSLLSAQSMPAWLVPVPGSATPSVRTSPASIESTYTTSASPGEVIAHHRALFETASIPFKPNFDGIGTTIRAAAAECDLLITVHEQSAGTLVRTACSVKSAAGPGEIVVTGKAAASRAQYQQDVTDMMQRHEMAVKALNIHPVRHDAPAPPLVWPDWLVHVRGNRLHAEPGVDQSKESYLEASYVTGEKMTVIYNFYQDVLSQNGYSVHNASLGTGHTTSGVVQNASGYVEGTNYPNGSPGARTVIHVSFSRSYLNEPIKVRARLTTYAYKAPPPFKP